MITSFYCGCFVVYSWSNTLFAIFHDVAVKRWITGVPKHTIPSKNGPMATQYKKSIS
jgi:hypothetical protein